ncbi:DUF6543 domain-containing protein [uncultured Pseudomonas sp.]|uniref:dermonecrotic toxin domain-containing protein n=1 Tax=uncultured Pseudomonas sp. TaxID=114707 RepID=UPI0025F74C1D|nr:DUF6543 domain-containing protein [uncultured Pseudomonas sp.]
MQISPNFSTLQHYATDDQPDALRGKRAIDTSAPKDQQLELNITARPSSEGGGYTQTSVDPDPGKSVGNSQKTVTPVNLGLNINVDPAAKEISRAFKSIEQEASDFLKEKFAQMKAQETDPAQKSKWDIDPDNTYLVTYDYNSLGDKPYPAKITQRISLTQALIKNAQDTPAGKGYAVAFFDGGPDVKVQDSLPMEKPGVFDFSSRFNPNSKNADITHSYQGIYIESPGAPSQIYNASNQSPITPEEFKKLIWKADFQKPYTAFLDEFWNSHKEKYPVLAKAAFVKSAMAQHQEGSLTTEGRELVMRAAGLPGNQDSWPDIKYEDLQKNPPKDPNIEIGLLKLGQYQSTDLMYITDNKVNLDANGNKLPPLTLLYIPGNSSPIHSFNSPAEMKTWLAAQMADPLKRNAMASHFALKDKPNGWDRAGIDETLSGLGTWPEKRETPGGLFSYDHRAFSGKWDPQEFITTETNNLPFEEITQRQKDRSYADASVKITSDRDVTKTNIIDGLEKAAKAALFLTPLSLVVPEVALALDTFYLASGAVTASIGVDDKTHGKTSGTDRIVFGLFNAATVVAPKVLGAAGKQVEEAAGESAHLEINPKPDSAPTPKEGESEANKLRPSEAGNVNVYAVSDGEQLIKDSVPGGAGIYQVRNALTNEDRWFIRYTDDSGISKVYEIKSDFKLSDNYVQIIDPKTRQAILTVHSDGNQGWVRVGGQGGLNFPWQRANARLDKEITRINQTKESFTDAERQKFSDDLTNLARQSKAERYQSMSQYTEAGSDEINNVLRNQPDKNLYPKEVKDFLSDFNAQADYTGTSYRYAHINQEGAEALKKGVGKVFRDKGVQSASTQAINVKQWDTWAAGNVSPKAEKPVIYVFDDSIKMKNLSSGLLPDHVAVPPDVSLEVLATKEKDGILYVYFGGPTKAPKQRYNLFDGTIARPF